MLELMHDRGHTELSTAHIAFYCNLNCGMSHASEVARRMGITRQAVYKTTRELQRLGALTLSMDPSDRRQKIITMTPLGEQIALDARECMAQIESHLRSRIGRENVELLYDVLSTDWGTPPVSE